MKESNGFFNYSEIEKRELEELELLRKMSKSLSEIVLLMRRYNSGLEVELDGSKNSEVRQQFIQA